MSSITRKNSFWQLYGMVIICWILYLFLVLLGSAAIALAPILVLLFFSIMIIISQWSSNVEVVFYDNHLTSKHYFKSKTNHYVYSDIKAADYLYTRVLGRRLVFKCSNSDDKSTEFVIYNPDNELLEFVSSHIKAYTNRIP